MLRLNRDQILFPIRSVWTSPTGQKLLSKFMPVGTISQGYYQGLQGPPALPLAKSVAGLPFLPGWCQEAGAAGSVHKSPPHAGSVVAGRTDSRSGLSRTGGLQGGQYGDQKISHQSLALQAPGG